MVHIQSILQAGVAVQTAALLGENVKLAKNPSTKNLIKTGVTNIVGIPLLTAQSRLIGGLTI